jgi:SRSO17 transposase
VEETSQFAKNETGLDHYQVRRYDAWYRHITLPMLAAAFLAVTAHTEQTPDQKEAPPAKTSS